MSDQIDILLVEDEAVVQLGAAKALRHEGWSVDVADDFSKGISRLRHRQYRVVLCDLMLPGESGLELLDRGKGISPATPFIMITGYATHAKALESFAAGAFDFIPKPFDTAEIVGVVDRARRWVSGPKHSCSSIPAECPRSGETTGEKYCLGEHSWAWLGRDGSATIGVGGTFLGTVPDIERVELPEEGEHTFQSKRLARFSSGHNAIHRVWAPLSGAVIAVNEDLRRISREVDDPLQEARWLVQIVPSQLELELELLIRC